MGDSESFGESRMYSWSRVKTNCYTNIYGYMPANIRIQEVGQLNPDVKVFDGNHCINNKDLLQEYNC